VPSGTSGNYLVHFNIGGSSTVALDVVQMQGDTVASGVLGADGVLYTVGQLGAVEARTASHLVTLWRGAVSDDSNEVFSVPLSVDCARDSSGAAIPGRPGTLYVRSDSGNLYSIIVDAHGIDTNAAWPKWGHDPRNTANSQTPMTEFVCP
jgi:hypothetical protein